MNTEMTVQNKKDGGRRKLVIAVCAAAVILISCIALFLAKDSLVFLSAQKKAENGNFASAASLLEKQDSEKALALKDYCALREEINSGYPAMLTDFDIDKIREWNAKASDIASRAGSLPSGIGASVYALSEKLGNISSLYDEYFEIRYDLLDLMDIFNEVNSLYTKDADGKNRTFTIAEERAKLRRWQEELSKTQNYIYKLPSEDKVYLLNYLAKEADAEIAELSRAMDKLIANSGVTETDEVRANGEGHKVFPSVESTSGANVTLMDKVPYEEHLFTGVCRALTETLAEYYVI